MVIPAQFDTVLAQDATSEPAADEGAAPSDEPADEPVDEGVEPSEAVEQPSEEPTTPSAVETEEVVPTEVVTEPAATPVVTEPVGVSTDEAAETATEASTDAVTSTDAAPESTDIATEEATPVEPADDFQQGSDFEWILSPGWSSITDGDNGYLSALTPGEIATVPTLNWEHLLISARVRVEPGNLAGVTFRSGYAARIDAQGSVWLYKDTTLLAEALSTVTPSPDAVWRTLGIQALGSTITIAVDDVVVITYDDPEALGAGSIVLSTGADNTGEVAFDDVSLTELDAPVEATAEATVEATLEATAEATPDAESAANIVLSADFEGELVGWLIGGDAGVVAESETNKALLMNSGSSLIPANPLYMEDLTIEARISLMAGDGSTDGIGITFRDEAGRHYLLTVAPTLVELYRVGTALPAAESTAEAAPEATAEPVSYDLTPVLLGSLDPALAADTWYSLSVSAMGGSLNVSIDGASILSYEDETALVGGSLGFSAAASLLIDDIVVTDYTVLDAIATPTPLSLAEVAAAKLTGDLIEILNLHIAGDEAGALAAAASYFVEIDDANRLGVIVYAAPDTLDAVTTLIETSGGAVDGFDGFGLNAHISLSSLAELVMAEEVGAIRLPARATSTDSSDVAARLSAVGNVAPVSLDIHGVNNWHEDNIRGSGVNIAVIDTDFGVLTGGDVPSNSNRSCLDDRTVFGAAGNGTAAAHGLNVVEVICDFAPESSVRMYQADNATEVRDALADAVDTDGARVVVITLDLGASASPGDGTDGTGTAFVGGDDVGDETTLYNALRAARELGVVVIASAGNNNNWDADFDGTTAERGAHIAFEYTFGGAAPTVPLTVFAGDTVHISWNDWNGSLNGATRENFDASLSGAFSFTIQNAAAARGIGTPPSLSTSITSGQCANVNGCAVTLSLAGAASAGSFGDAGTVDFQVQVTGQGFVSNIAGVTNTAGGVSTIAGNLARPADSDYVLAVGAVCADPADRYPVIRTSSTGPVFDANGSIPASLPSNPTRDQVKPDMAASSHVETSVRPFTRLADGTVIGDGCVSGIPPSNGFNGTSAAASHIAGMAALLISNDDNSSMRDRFDSFDSSATTARVDAIEDYLQARSMDLFGFSPENPPNGDPYDVARTSAGYADGWDFYHGSGLAVLGNPAYNLNDVENFADAALASEIFVGQGNLDTTQTGSANNPYVHLADALAVAAASGTVDTIIVQPGEYVSSFEIDDTLPGADLTIIGYDEFNTGGTFSDTTIWVNDNFDELAGIVIERQEITLRGFVVLAASPDGSLRGPGTRFSQPKPLLIGSTQTIVLADNEFNNFTAPIVLEDAEGVEIARNRFFGFTSEDSTQGTSVLDMLNSGDGFLQGVSTVTVAPIVIELNEFNNNIADETPTIGLAAIINSEVTAVIPGDPPPARANRLLIQANTFAGNRASTILRVRHDSDNTTEEVVMTSNQILANALRGPIVHMEELRLFRFINNSVINNGLDGEETKIAGFESLFIHGFSGGAPNEFEWEIHNNLFYSNQTGNQKGTNTDIADPTNGSASIVFDDLADGNRCFSIEGGATIRHNWFWRSGLPLTGECSRQSTNNVNLVGAQLPGVDPDIDNDDLPEVIILLDNPNNPGNDVQVRLGEYDAHDNFFSFNEQQAFPLPGDPETTITLGGRVNEAFGEPGSVIEQGDNIAYRDMARAVLNNPSFDIDSPANYATLQATFFDLNGAIRRFSPPPSGSNSPHVGNVDIGAIEFESEIQAIDAPDDTVVTINEDELSVELPLIATGGFQPYDFSISQSPTGIVTVDSEDISSVIFNTSISSPCNGQPFVFNRRSNRVRYCPPADFFTDGTPGDDVPQNITLKYVVGDILTGDTDEGTVTLNITADGDNTPVSANYLVNVIANEPFTFRLRPFADFTNNFRRSTANFGSDYRYDYNFVQISYTGDAIFDGTTEGIIANQINDAETDGLVENITPEPNSVGEAIIEYTATDSFPDGAPRVTTHFVTISLREGLVGTGVYDDTSREVFYSGNWTPLFSEPNINNSLHNSTTLNNSASLVFEGNAIVIYMQGDSRNGAYWTFEVLNNDTLEIETFADLFDPTLPPSNRCTISDGTVATTTRLVGDELQLSNRTARPYTVACDGFDDEGVYTLNIFNREGGRVVSLDAIEVIDLDLELGDDVLLPGTHEITAPEVVRAFDDNGDPSDGYLTGWQQLVNTSATRSIAMIGTASPDIEPISFLFKGTGVAIGTALTSTGVDYELCVQRVGETAETCQTFNNGGVRSTTFGSYRSFYGFDNFDVLLSGNPVDDIFDTYRATIDVISTGGQQLIIDEIVVIGEAVPETMPLGQVEATDFTRFVYGGFTDTTWAFETAARGVSNGDMAKQNRGINGIGPFISFVVPGDADTVNWHRTTARTSAQVLICVDRARFGDGSCAGPFNLADRNIPNPISIRDDAGGAWGEWEDYSEHTIEIFSTNNAPFDLDFINVLSLGTDFDNAGFIGAGRFDVGRTDELVRFAFEGQTPALEANSRYIGGNALRFTTNNAGALFKFEGTGFGVQFLADSGSDAARLCWAEGEFLTSGLLLSDPDHECQYYDNQSSSAVYGLERAVRGLNDGQYTAFVQFLGDQGQPAVHPPVDMTIDGVVVYNDTWESLEPIADNTRYETNASLREQVVYSGTWTYLTRQRSVSNGDVDSTRGAAGAAAIFKVGDVDTLTVIRSTSRGYAPTEICATGIDPITAEIETDRECVVIFNDVVTGTQQAFTFLLPEPGSTEAYVVSIVTQNGGEFRLDALEARDANFVLPPGTYSDTDPALRYSFGSAQCATPGFCPPFADWQPVSNRAFVGGFATGLRLTTVTNASAGYVDFTFEGSGFTLYNLLNNLGKANGVEVSIFAGNVDPDSASPFYSETVTSFSSGTGTSNDYSLTGLDADSTYTVRVEDVFVGDDAQLIIDGLQIHGEFAENLLEAGFYDDRALSDGSPVLSFFGRSWEFQNATTTISQTLSRNGKAGGSAVFAVDNASAFTLYHPASATNSSLVRVCWREADEATFNLTDPCVTLNLNSGSTKLVPLTQSGTPTVDDYIVSITNLTADVALPIDALGVLNPTSDLPGGIYQNTFTGSSSFTNGGSNIANTTATDGSVSSLGNGQSIAVDFEGVGFSIVAVGGAANSSSFTVNVSGGIGDVTSEVTPATIPTSGLYALSKVGLPDGSYTVTITNNSASPLLIDRVDILGAPAERIGDEETGLIGFGDSRIQYLPIGLFSLTSGQRQSSIPGSAVYFEFDLEADDESVEYRFAPLSTGGNVAFCVGDLGSDNCAPTNVSTNVAPVLPTVTGVDDNVWVGITNRNGGILPFQSVSLGASVGDVFTAGTYAETLLDTFAADGSTPNIFGSVPGLNIFTSTVDEAALFSFDGTGFRFNFVRESTGGLVEICWAPGELANPDAVEASGDRICQTYNTSSSATTFNGAAAVNGLDEGEYTAFARFEGTPLAQTMRIDGFEVYNNTPEVALEPGARYETNFATRSGRFEYTGATGWTYNFSTRNSGNSNFDFDTTTVPGNSLIFSTSDDVAVVTVLRNTARGFSPLEICAVPDDNPNTRSCAIFTNDYATGAQQPFSFVLPGANDEHVVTITSLTSGAFTIDAIEASDGAALTAGLYQEGAAGIRYSGVETTSTDRTLLIPNWTGIVNRAYSGGAGATTTTVNASVSFNFEGTGFEIGTPIDRAAGDFRVCYEAEPVSGDIDAHCFTYTTLTASNTVSRTVAGLPFDEYAVEATNLLDSAGAARQIIDFVRIFDDEPLTISEAGVYDDSTTASPETFLLTLPETNWRTFTGRDAGGGSFGSLRAVADTSGRSSSSFAGPVGVLSVDVPAGGATLVINLGPATRFGRTGDVLVCVDHVDVASCTATPFANLATVKAIGVQLPDDGGNPTTRTVTIRTTEPSGLSIDGYNVIFNGVLGTGFHDDTLTSDAQLGGGGVLNFAGGWSRTKDRGALGGTSAAASTNGATLDFTFEGTGFSIVARSERSGLDFLVCYQEDGNGAAYPTSISETALNDALAAGVICTVYSADTDTTTWNLPAVTNAEFNGMIGRPIPRRIEQYGYAIFGLEDDTYDVRVRVVDESFTAGREFLKIDGVAVFGDEPDTLPPGFYDDTDSAITYEPAVMWTTAINRSGPARGPWLRTEHLGINAGMIANVQFDGDSLILYQTTSSRVSRNVNYCLVGTGGDPICGSFSQNQRTTRTLAPIMFYGFGGGDHWLVFENRDHGQNMGIDAVRVMP
jgi:hypothetical protein